MIALNEFEFNRFLYYYRCKARLIIEIKIQKYLWVLNVVISN